MIILILCSGCFGLFDSGSKTICGKYKLVWIDFQEDQGIIEEFENSGSGETIVPEYVFSVGHNENFIIAKQHPTSGFDTGHIIDTSIINYFIIDMNKKVLLSHDKVLGPLTKNEFDSLRIELNISNIKFDINYPEIYTDKH